MLKIIGFLLIVWLAFTIIGFVVRGLFWLSVIGIVLFLATAAWGWLKGRSRT